MPVADVGSNAFVASAWYLLTGPGGPSEPHVTTSAFSVAQNQVLSTTPISSVTPSSAWPGGNSLTVDTTGGSVVIDAKNAISGEDFNTWMVFGAGSANGDDLSVAQNNSALAIASFKEPDEDKVPLPAPELEAVLDIFDRFREKVGGWVADPAPIDLARVYSRAGRVEGRAAVEDELTKLTQNVGNLSKAELEEAKAMLDSRVGRLQTAQRIIDSAMKR